MSCRRSISEKSRRPRAACTTWSSTNFPTRRTLARAESEPANWNASMNQGYFMQLRAAPYFLCGLDDQPQLRGLRVTPDFLAVYSTRKSALRRKAELIERHQACCLLDLALQHVLGFELPELGRHQPEHDGLSRRDEAQRRKVARARVVILEEIPVDLQLVEQHFRHRLVAALGYPRALEVAPAKMYADRHALRAVRDGGVDQARVSPRQLVRVIAALPCAVSHLRVAQIGKGGSVERQVGAPGFAERAYLGAIRGRHIGKEKFEVRIRFAADRVASSTEMQHGRRRNRDLWRALRHRPQELEVVDLDRLDVPPRCGDVHDWGRKVHVTRSAVKVHRNAASGFYARKLLQKIDVEVSAAKFAVGDSAEAQIFLKADDVPDGGILDVTKLAAQKLAFSGALTRIEQLAGSQKAADVIGPKRRHFAFSHEAKSSVRRNGGERFIRCNS